MASCSPNLWRPQHHCGRRHRRGALTGRCLSRHHQARHRARTTTHPADSAELIEPRGDRRAQIRGSSHYKPGGRTGASRELAVAAGEAAQGAGEDRAPSSLRLGALTAAFLSLAFNQGFAAAVRSGGKRAKTTGQVSGLLGEAGDRGREGRARLEPRLRSEVATALSGPAMHVLQLPPGQWPDTGPPLRKAPPSSPSAALAS